MNKEDIELDILQILNDFRTDGRRAMDVAADIMNVFEFHAKPLPEPIGFVHPDVFESYMLENGFATMACKKPADIEYKIPLYAEPPARNPLSDDEIFEILSSLDGDAKRLPLGFKLFARKIESAHGIGKDNANA